MASRELVQNIETAKMGKKVWENWIKEMKISKEDCVLVFPHTDRTFNEIFIRYLMVFKEKRNYKGAVLIFSEKNEEAKGLLDDIKDRSFIVSEKQIESVIKLFGLYEFSNRLIVCSLDKPDGRMGKRMLEKDMDYSLEEIIRVGVFRI